MVDYSTPLQIKGPDPEAGLKAYGAATQLQLGQAHARLFGQQADLQQMRVNALQQWGDKAAAGDTDALNKLSAAAPDLANQLVKNQKETLELGQERSKVNDLKSYSDAMEANDPHAIRSAGNRLLRSSPETYKTIADAASTMNKTQFEKLTQTYDAMGRAANSVLAVPAGPERDKAWSEQLDELSKGGIINADQRQRLGDKANPLVLRNALVHSMAVKDYMEASGQTAGNKAEAELPSRLAVVGAEGAQHRQTEQFGAQFRPVQMPVTGPDGVVREVTMPASQLPAATSTGTGTAPPRQLGGGASGPAPAPNQLAAAGGPPAAAPAPAAALPPVTAAPRSPVATAPLAVPPEDAGSTTPPGKPVYNKEQEAILGARGKAFEEGMEERKTAVQAKERLATVRNSLDRFQTGPTAELRRDAGAGVIEAFKLLGLKPSVDLEKSVAASDLITKEGTRLGFDLARQLGGREPGFIVQQAVSVNPNIKLTDLSNRQIVGILEADLQRKIDMQDAREKWAEQRGNQAGFDRWFNESHPAEVYVSRAVPAPLPKTPDAKAMKNGWTYDTPRGPATWNGDKQVFEPVQ